MKQTGPRKFTLHDGNGNAGIGYNNSLGFQENDSDVSLVPPIVSKALKGQETLDLIHSLCLKSQRKKLICENATEDFVNHAVNVNVDVNLSSVIEGPEFVTAILKQELGIMPSQGTSIHQAKPWSAHDVEVNDERLEYHALHPFDKMPRPDVYSWNAILGCYFKAKGLMDAGELFLKILERNIVSWKTLISAL
ncbi:putative pentatricopeptide [Rosa chinensis]|uniref:Putative pentatricopeptide n=1 Tax=Rosa chinensis TaxID=74649 RepID=A0A2P6PQY7_ROSCH|nr:putative pentatricopeptide [Rosa chinensis]